MTLERIARFQAQVASLRQGETNPANYHASVSGFLAEIDRMQLEVREHLSLHPAELAAGESIDAIVAGYRGRVSRKAVLEVIRKERGPLP